MDEKKLSKLDTFVAPTEEQLQAVGRQLLTNIRTAIARDSAYGMESDGFWKFEVEGHRGLIDHEGYFRGPILDVIPDTKAEVSTRDITLLTGRMATGSAEIKLDIYEVSFIKNTEGVQSVKRAVINADEFVARHAESQEELSEFLGSGGLSMDDAMDRISDILSAPSRSFNLDLAMQLGFGACSQQEIIELLEILQRATPTDNVELLLKYGQYPLASD